MTSELLRDYDNTYDRNAILAKIDGLELGYVARLPAQVLAPDIDSGRDVIGKVLHWKSDPALAVLIEVTDRAPVDRR